MRQSRWLPLAAVLGLLVPQAQAVAQETKPAVVVRVKPIHEIVRDVAALSGGLMSAEQLDALADQTATGLFGDAWKKAVDPAKPIGFYAAVSEDIVSSTAVLMVPVKEPKAFLAVLKRAGIEPDENEGVYSFTPPAAAPVPLPPLSFKFSGGYAYATFNAVEALEKDKLLPAAGLGGNPASVLDVTIHIDRVPENLRTLAAAQAEQFLKNAADNGGDLGNGVKVKAKDVKQLIEAINQFLETGKTLTFGVSADRAKGEAALDFGLTAKEGSKLAKELTAALAPVTSKMAGLVGADGVLRVVMSSKNTNAKDPAAAAALEENLTEQLEKVPDEDMRKLLGGLVKPLSQALMVDEFDATLGLKGPSGSGRYTLVAGMKLKDAAKLEKAVIDTVGKMPEEQKALFKLAPSGGVHKLMVSPSVPDELKAAFGEGEVNLAFRGDAVVLTYGAEGQAALKADLTTPEKLPLFVFDVTPSKLLPLVKLAAEKGDDEKMKKALPVVEKVLSKMTEPVRLLNISADAKGGDSLVVRYGVNVAAIAKFAAAAQQAEKAGKKGDD